MYTNSACKPQNIFGIFFLPPSQSVDTTQTTTTSTGPWGLASRCKFWSQAVANLDQVGMTRRQQSRSQAEHRPNPSCLPQAIATCAHAHWRLISLKAREAIGLHRRCMSCLQKGRLSSSSVENRWDIHRNECVEQTVNPVGINSVQVSSSSKTSLVQQVNATVNH